MRLLHNWFTESWKAEATVLSRTTFRCSSSHNMIRRNILRDYYPIISCNITILQRLFAEKLSEYQCTHTRILTNSLKCMRLIQYFPINL